MPEPAAAVLFDGDIALIKMAARGSMSYRSLPVTMKRTVDRLVEGKLLMMNDDAVLVTDLGVRAATETRP